MHISRWNLGSKPLARGWRGMLLAAIALSGVHSAAISSETESPVPEANAAPATPIAAFIDALGDESYRVRRSAAVQILSHGESARDALAKTAQQHADPEVRRRSQQLIDALDAIRAKAYRDSLESRLAAFIADDRAGEVDYEFPGWQAFRGTVGSDRSARELFAQMQREEPELLACSEGDVRELGRALSARIMNITQSLSHPLPHFRSTVTPGRAAALYFTAANKDLSLDSRLGSQMYSMASQATVRSALVDAEKGGSLRKVVGNWVALEQEGDKNLAYYKVLVAMQHNIPEGRQAGLNLIKDEKAAATSYQFLQGLMAIARFGTKDDIDAVEPLLTNNTVCQTVTLNSVAYTTQVRDAALVVLIQLTGQEHRDYGFDRLQKNANSIFATHTMGFPRDDNAARDEAVLKWRVWRASQKKRDASQQETPK